MPLEQPSDYPKAALQAHNSLSAPTHFSPVPDTPESQVMSPNTGSASSVLPPIPPFPVHLRRVEMSEVALSHEMLQQIASLVNSGPEAMNVDDGAELSQAVREIASQMKGRTEILAGALQSVATSTQGISDRVVLLEQQLTESNRREQMLVDRLQAFSKSQEGRLKSVESTMETIGQALQAMQQAITAMQASLEEHRSLTKASTDRAEVSQTDAALRVSVLEDQHQTMMDLVNQLSIQQVPADAQQGQGIAGYMSPVATARPEHFSLTPSPAEPDTGGEDEWWDAADGPHAVPPGFPQ